MAYVGATLVDATPTEALAAVVGYSTFNDLTSRRAQKLTSQWILGKNGDRSGPLGPMVDAAEVGDLRDGLRVQDVERPARVRPAREDRDEDENPPIAVRYQEARLSLGKARSGAPIIIGSRKLPKVVGIDGTRKNHTMMMPCMENSRS